MEKVANGDAFPRPREVHIWWGEAPEWPIGVAKHLVISVHLRSWAVNRAEPRSVVGHGSARLVASLIGPWGFCGLPLVEPRALWEPRPTRALTLSEPVPLTTSRNEDLGEVAPNTALA
jgi:hypothetical protein